MIRFTIVALLTLIFNFQVFSLGFLSEESNPLEGLESVELIKLIEELQNQIKEFSNDSEKLNGWSGNGGDFNNESDNIWFVGEKAVRYCILSDENYPLNKSQLQVLVKETIDEWKTFFTRYKLQNSSVNGAGESGLQFPDRVERKLSLEFNEFSCDISDIEKTPKESIHFLFGVSNKILSTYKNLATEHALGIALRQKYNHKTYRNGGLVWLGNFSPERNKIKHLLLHEMGHVFGMKHNSVFVMDEHVADQVQNKEIFLESFFGKIESDSWRYRIIPRETLVLTSHKGRTFPGARGCANNDRYLPIRFMPKRIRPIFGFRNKGCFKATLKMLAGLDAKKRKTFVLEFTNLRGNIRQTLTGKFSYQKKKAVKSTPSPGLFTFWKNPLGEVGDGNLSLLWRRLNLDKRPFEIPAQGSFDVRNRKLGVRIANDKGIHVSIFLPNGRWWNLKNIHNGILE
jgi:hypothetical protein